MSTAEALRATEGAATLADRVWAALSTVMDPELDEPVTDLGFVRSHRVDGADVEVHLRLPTSFCSPSFAYLMAADANDALLALPDVGRVVGVLDDHHDSDKINGGLAASAGYVGTFADEADESLDELRLVFRRKAHTAAMERAVGRLTSVTPLDPADLHGVRLTDLVPGREKDALLKRRADLGLPTHEDSLVLVDELGREFPVDQIPLRLRFARTTRISIDGNAHFCRGLLRTRYADAGDDQAPRAQDPEPELFQITTRRPGTGPADTERED